MPYPPAGDVVGPGSERRWPLLGGEGGSGPHTAPPERGYYIIGPASPFNEQPSKDHRASKLTPSNSLTYPKTINPTSTTLKVDTCSSNPTQGIGGPIIESLRSYFLPWTRKIDQLGV